MGKKAIHIKMVVLTEMKIYQDSLKLSGSLRVRKPKKAHRISKRMLNDNGMARLSRGMLQRSSTYLLVGIGIFRMAFGSFNRLLVTTRPTCNIMTYNLIMDCPYMSTLNWVYKTYSFKGAGCQWKTNVDSVHFQNFIPFFLSFSWQIIYMNNVDVYIFWGGVWESLFCTLI